MKRQHDLRKKLKAAFDLRGVTYQSLATEVGISKASLHRKLNGSQVMSVADAERLAKLLGVKIEVTARRVD